MDAAIAKHEVPKPGAAPLQYSEMHTSSFGAQLVANLRRDFTVYNRAPGETSVRLALQALWLPVIMHTWCARTMAECLLA